MTKPTESTSAASRRVQLETHLRWVPLDEMRFPEEGKGQRSLKAYRVNKITSAGFNPDIMGYPVVSFRDEHYWCVDGHARIDALKEWLGEWKGQTVQCRVFFGLTVAEEAGLFLALNDFTQIPAFPRFLNAVTNEQPTQTDIDRIVRAHGLVISQSRSRDDSVPCVTALERVYEQAGPPVFAQDVRIIRDAFGKPGFTAPIVVGLGMLCTRYNGQLQETAAVEKLGAIRGGVNGLLGRAHKIRQSSAASLTEAIAAAAVDIINVGTPNNKKLKPWFKSATPSANGSTKRASP